MKILIRGSYDSYNFGDDALLIAVLFFLENNLGLNMDNTEIYVERASHSLEKLCYQFSSKLRNSPNILSSINKLAPILKALGFPKVLRVAVSCVTFMFFLLAIFLFRIFGKAPFFKEIIEFFRNLDIIHYIGGGYIAEIWKWRMIYEYLVVTIAKMINPKLKIFGTGLGLGPFESRLCLLLLRGFLKKFDAIFLRESESYKIVKKLGVKPYTKCLGDDILLLYPILKSLREDPNSEKVIAVNFKDFPDYTYPRGSIYQILSLLIQNGFKIHYFCFGEEPGPNDYKVLLSICGPDLVGNLIIHSPYKEGFWTFLKNLANVNLGFGCAYHFGLILSIIDIPSIVIYSGAYYRQKITGAMDFIGRPYQVCEVDKLKDPMAFIKDFHVLRSCFRFSQDQLLINLYATMVEEYMRVYRESLSR